MLAYFSICLIVLLSLCGLATDVGRIEIRRLQLQAAADAGSIGGSAALAAGGTDWKTVAQDDALASEKANGLASATNVAQIGATSGTYAGNNSAVQVQVSDNVHTLFLGLLSSGDANVPVKLTSVSVGSASTCMYLSGSPALTGAPLAGTSFYLTSGGLNTTCNIYSGTTLDEDITAYIRGTGQVSTAQPTSSSVVAGQINKPLIGGVTGVDDPLAYLPQPTYSGCSQPTSNYTGAATTISPGVYCNGLTINGVHVTMAAGLYVIEGPANFVNSQITGNGVTLFFTKNAANRYGPVNWNSVSFSVSAPTTSSGGALAGIVVFGDRSWTGGNQDFVFTNGSSFGADGIFYISNTGFQDGQCNLAGLHYFDVVAANFSLNNATVSISDDFSSLPGGSPLHSSVVTVQ